MIFDEETAAIRESLRRGRLLADLGSEWRELKAGTFYGLLLDHRISAEEAARIVDVWREHGPDSKLIVLDAGMQIEELDDDRLRELGLFAHRGVLMGLSERWRTAALVPFTDAPTATTGEWLRVLELGADAAVRVVLEHLRDHSELFYWGPDSDWREEDAIPLYRVEKLLSEMSDA